MLLNGSDLNGISTLSPRTVELMTVNHVGDLSHFYAGMVLVLVFQSVRNLGHQAHLAHRESSDV